MTNRSAITRRALAITAVAALTLSGCGDDDGGDGADQEQGSAAPAGEAGGGERPSGPEDAMTAEDGWVDLHDLELPAPGTAVVTIDGDRYEIDDLECAGPGEREPGDDGLWLFSVAAQGSFETTDGREATVEVYRRVVPFDEWSATGGAGDVYDYPGQDEASVSIVVEVELESGSTGWHSSIRVAPADDDRTGEHLPLVHVSPDGGFTVDTEVEALMASIHTDALVGSVQIAGQCAAPWSEQSNATMLGLG